MLTIRDATMADAALIWRLVWELADFDGEAQHVHTCEADIARDGFGETPLFHTLIAEWEGKPAGFALFFPYYSTWKGAGLYLEDLYVRAEYRRRGIGAALLASVARAAQRKGLHFVRWAVLNWNESAIGMYRSLGACILDDWRIAVLAGEDLRRLGNKSRRHDDD